MRRQAILQQDICQQTICKSPTNRKLRYRQTAIQFRTTMVILSHSKCHEKTGETNAPFQIHENNTIERPRKHPESIPKASRRHPEGIRRHFEDIPKAFRRHSEDIPKTSRRHPEDIPKTSDSIHFSLSISPYNTIGLETRTHASTTNNIHIYARFSESNV